MRITTGITLALLMSTAGCGGDDEDGGVLSPTGPSAVSLPATPKGGLATAQAMYRTRFPGHALRGMA